jgi:hypothetical protein
MIYIANEMITLPNITTVIELLIALAGPSIIFEDSKYDYNLISYIHLIMEELIWKE